jgi:hypothetical protein
MIFSNFNRRTATAAYCPMNKKATKKPAPTFDPNKTKEAEQLRQKRDRKSGSKSNGTKSAGRGGNGHEPEPEAIADLELHEPPFECYYDSTKSRYFLKDDAGRWISVGVDDLRRELRAHGISGKALETKLVSRQDRAMRAVQRKYGIDFAGPLAGHFAGPVTMNGKRLLVTSSPQLPEPRKGAFPIVEKFLKDLFGVNVDAYGATQYAALCLWIARGWKAIKTGKCLKGHALILAGPAGCGKNVLQERIITPLLGGREVKAGDFLLGRTEFGGSSFSGESLTLTDENGGRDIRSRREFGQRIKYLVANTVQEMHHKGRDSIGVSTTRRLSISVNDEAEHLQTLPLVGDADIRDKIHLFLCHPAELPESDEDFEAWCEDLAGELPAWLDYCLALKVPPELREARPRFGTKHFHHPELLARLNSFSPEYHLLAIIDQFADQLFETCPFEDDNPEASTPKMWKGNASQLRKKLLELADGKLTLEREITDLLRSDVICGQYLSRLSQHEATKARVQEGARWGSTRSWIIMPLVSEAEA